MMWQHLYVLNVLSVVAEQCGGGPGSGLCRVTGPASPDNQTAWLAELVQDRDTTIKRIGFVDGVFNNPKMVWTQTAYIQTQMHPYDRYFYNKEQGHYTISKWIDDVNERYGGLDAALIWPSYPNLGIDDRNQFDYIRALPGGIEGVANFTAQLRHRGVRVLLPFLTWDTATRREPNMTDQETIVTVLRQVGGAGLNGDSIPFVPKAFWDISVSENYPLALQAEGGARDQALNWSTMGWGYWGRQSNPSDAAGYNWTYETVPLVDRFKFITRGKWLTSICERYAKNKTADLQMAWFNGIGYEAWENVWGAWNGIVPRDGEAIRRVATMLRHWGNEGFLQSAGWEPHALGPDDYAVFASKWPLPARNATLWSIVNRQNKNFTGASFTIPRRDGNWWYYDCYNGVELLPSLFLADETLSNVATTRLSFALEAGGFGCILELPSPADANLTAYLEYMKGLATRSLASYDAAWVFMTQQMVQIPRTPIAKEAPSGMVYIPRGNFTFSAQGIEIEGKDALGVDVQFPWEHSPQRKHTQVLDLGPFYMDKYPVTVQNYSSYLNATGYRPRESHNWLKNWNGSMIPDASLWNLPVTYIGLEEARAYCKWAHDGSRLPHSYEWQYAGQGLDSRKYPWGNTKDKTKYPVLTSGNVYVGPEPVGKYSPAGDSPHGVGDMVGSVWQYTDEFLDDHTSRAILRGGSNYAAKGSGWYYRQALELNTYNLYLLMSNSYERAGTVGFRCVKDATDNHEPSMYTGSLTQTFV